MASIRPLIAQTGLLAIGQVGTNRLHSRMFTMSKDIWEAKFSLTISASKLRI
jgi:hypothetical protein